MEKIVYTFRTFPYLEKLPASLGDIFVLHTLKNDIKKLCFKILQNKPSCIIGLAKSDSNFSTFESVTVNQFHANGKVIKDSQITEFLMDLPPNPPFKIRTQPTKSFCNYSMFSIQSFLSENKLNIPFFFLHITEKDMESLPALFSPFI